MKKIPLIATLLIVTGFILLQGSRTISQDQKSNGFYSDEAKTVIDNKCYGCHSIKGKSQDAKDALMWDSLPGLSKAKIVATLNDMIEVLEEDKMPPEQMVKKMPEMKLLPDEKQTLLTWAETKAGRLLMNPEKR